MRGPLELLDLPFSFMQLPLLMGHEFIREARDRGVQMSEVELEGLHRLGLIKPMFRVRRDGRLIARLARQQDPLAWQVAHWHPTSRRDLVEAREDGRLFGAASEPFISRRRLQRSVAGIEYRASEYLYSHYQLLLVQTIAPALSHLTYRRSGPTVEVVGLTVNRLWRSQAMWWARCLDERVVALSALEPIYHGRIVGSLRVGSDEEFELYQRWRRRLRLTETQKWLGVRSDWLMETGAGLLRRADAIDPLGDWLDVVREAEPDRWQRLKGKARSAIDMRIAAELVLRYYDHLAAGRRARPLAKAQGRWRGEFDSRLKPQRKLDKVLTDYGLSPHPSLVLVVEGATEQLLFPRLMEFFGIRTDDDFIAIQNAEGVGTDLSPLLAYAIAPRAEAREGTAYLRLLRPLTRVLVVTDAEGPMRTKEQRGKRREVWTERILRTFSKAHRTAAVRDALRRLVYVETWNRRGLSFEFAHFTDHQLARAIAQLDQRDRQPALQDRARQIARVRSRRGNIDSVMGGMSKVALADELWPVLERKIKRAQQRKTEARIPIVRVLDRATDLARELPRRNVVIPLYEANRSGGAASARSGR